MSSDLKRQVGHRVQALREARGFTQEQLAGLIGRSVEAISKIERGKAFPAPDTFEVLSRHLSVAVRDLFPEAPTANDSRARLEARASVLVAGLSDKALEASLEILATLARLSPG